MVVNSDTCLISLNFITKQLLTFVILRLRYATASTNTSLFFGLKNERNFVNVDPHLCGRGNMG